MPVALWCALVAGDGKPSRKRRFERDPVSGLQGLSQLTLTGVSLPVVDGVRHFDSVR